VTGQNKENSMPQSETAPLVPENKLLAALSAKCYKRLVPDLDMVEMNLGKILYNQKEHIKYVYFPRWAAVSMVNIFENGSMVEVGVVGREGMVGVSLLSGDNISSYQAIVQIADGGWRMKALVFKQEIERNGELANVTRRYLQALFTQVAQTASCNRMHPIVKRLARWLLLMQDRVESDELQLTHEFIATMLGTRRAGVTIAAGTLQAAGIIKYHRGKVTILDQKKLEEASCECHRIVRNEYKRLLGSYDPAGR
jgi:CRP-like cAMP-binding protein